MSLACLRSSCALLLACFATAAAVAQPARQATGETSAEVAVRAVFSDYVAAFNRRDAAALGAPWTEQGVFVNESNGDRSTGRAAMVADFAALFDAEPEVTLTGRIESVRFIRPDVAQVTGQAVTVGPGEAPNASRFTAILVREGRRWLFDSIHETLVPAAPTPYEQLQALEFLVGQWGDDTEEARVDTTVRWGANRSFLVRSYTIQRDDAEALQGTQVIGWDPRQQQIRSWMFDSDGSFGEGVWLASDNGWTVKLKQTLADGGLAGATHVITSVDRDTLIVRMVGREVAGQSLPATDPVRVVRVREQAE